MKRILSLFLAVALISVLALPVTVAAAESSGWIELLELTSIQTNGENWFTINGTTGSFSVSVEGEKRLRKVDMLLWNPTGQRPTAASCTNGSKTNTLDIYSIGSNLTRIVGYLPDAFYETIKIDLKKGTSSSQTYEVLSFKVTPIGVQEFACAAQVYIDGGYYGTNELIEIPGVDNEESPGYGQITVIVDEWQKFDSMSIWGSVTDMSVNSIRASIGTTGIPFTISYSEPSNGGYWFEYDEYESGYTYDDIYSGDDWATGEATIIPAGKMLYCITLDLTALDRTLIDDLVIYFTGLYEPVWGYTFNCQYVNGSVATADTTTVSWWYRFTSFMTGLFSPSDPDADEFGSTMESQAGAMQDAVDEMDQVTKPDVDDLDISLDEFMSDDSMKSVNGVLDAIFANEIIVTMLVICLTCAFASYALFGKR